MCYQVVERYALCGCTYHVHAVDPCQRANDHYHAVTIRETLVGYNCSRHSGTKLPGFQTRVVPSQQSSIIKQPQDDPPKEPRFPGRIWTKNEPLIDDGSACGYNEGRSLQTAIAAYDARETSINRNLEAIVAPSTGKDIADDDDCSSVPSSIFGGASASSKSSVERPPDFAEELLSEFVNNVTLVPLFRLALKCNPNQFIKTFTVLLRLYSKDLGHVSSSPLEKDASMVINARSRYIASHLEDYFVGCNPKEVPPEKRMPKVGPRAQDTDASDDGDNHDPSKVPHLVKLRLVQVKRFLFDDVPFLKLRQRLEKLAGEVSDPSDAAAPDQSTSKYYDTHKRIDDLKPSQRSVLENKWIGSQVLRGQISVEQETVAIEHNGEQTERPDAPEIADGSSSVPKTLELRPIHPRFPYSEENLSPNEVPEGNLVPLTIKSDQEEGLTAFKISVLTDNNFGQELARTAASHETASSVFLRTVLLVVLIKKLGRRKRDIRVELRDPRLTTSELPAAPEGSLASCCSKDGSPMNCHQSSWSQVAKNELRYKTKGALCKESTPLLGGDWRVQEVSWVCSCGKVVVEHLEQLQPGGIPQFLDEVNTSFGRSSKDPNEYASSSGWPRRNKFFVLLGGLLNRWNHSGHAFITRTADSCVPTEDSVPSDQSSQPAHSPTKTRTGWHPNVLQQHINCTCISCGGSQDSSAASSSGSSTMVASYAWIHVCIESYAGRIQLKSIDIRGFPTDGPMFMKINEVYFGTGFWRLIRRTFSLRVLSSVELVHFNVDRRNTVAIDTRDHQKLPPPKEYLYIPCPPVIAGLVPRTFLYFCITNPSATYGHFHIWRDRLPKYTGEELRCQPDEPFTLGYGLYFKETLSWIKVWIIMAVFTVSSFTFSGIWIRYHDGAIQDAFAMGGSMLTVVTIGLGLVHGLDAFWSDRLRGDG